MASPTELPGGYPIYGGPEKKGHMVSVVILEISEKCPNFFYARSMRR